MTPVAVVLRTIAVSCTAGLLLASPARAQMDHSHHAVAQGDGGQHGVLGLDVYVDRGDVHLLEGRIDSGDAAPTLWYQRSRDGGRTWTDAVRIPAAPPPYRMERGDDPQIAADGDRILVAWTAAGSGWGGSGPLVTALSNDGGASWSTGGRPAGTENNEGQAFADIVASGGVFHMVWLDERDKVYGLRYSSSPDGREWSRNTTLERQSCECCWNTIVAQPSGALDVLFRNGKPRDMALARKEAGGDWAAITPVGAFDWRIDACPHVGGGLALGPGEAMHSVVWTGEEKAPGLYYVASGDGGKSWAVKRRLGSSDAQHADVAAQGKNVIAVWDQGAAAEAVYGAVSSDGGKRWRWPRKLSSDSAVATHPRVLSVKDAFLVVWTERKGGEWRLRLRRIAAGS